MHIYHMARNILFKAPRGIGWLTNSWHAAHNRVYNRTCKGCLVILTLLLFAGVSITFLACDQASPPTAPEQVSPKLPSPPASNNSRITYEIVKEWVIPDGGHGRVIVVDSEQRTEAGLLAIAEQIRRDTNNDRNTIVFIYDERDAATLRDAALDERLNKAEMKRHDDHMIGSYFRIANTGFHAITVALQGVNGPMREIPLR